MLFPRLLELMGLFIYIINKKHDRNDLINLLSTNNIKFDYSKQIYKNKLIDVFNIIEVKELNVHVYYYDQTILFCYFEIPDNDNDCIREIRNFLQKECYKKRINSPGEWLYLVFISKTKKYEYYSRDKQNKIILEYDKQYNNKIIFTIENNQADEYFSKSQNEKVNDI